MWIAQIGSMSEAQITLVCSQCMERCAAGNTWPPDLAEFVALVSASGANPFNLTSESVMAEYKRWRNESYRYSGSDKYPWKQDVLYHICIEMRRTGVERNLTETHSDYHHHELVPFRHSTGVIIACWHCDNELKNQTEQTLDQLVGVNNADWVIDTARIALGLDAQRSLSLAELCWWAVGAGIGDEITEEMARRSLRIKDDGIKSVYRESEIVPSVPATSILSPRLEKTIKPTAITTPGKPLVPVNVDPVAPATLFARPKRSRWLSADFISWVKKQPCMCCGQPADDAHHLIGWGQGGVGTKAHDVFTIPLCRKHHRALHHDPAAFEREYGTQPVLIIKLLDRAYALGVLA